MFAKRQKKKKLVVPDREFNTERFQYTSQINDEKPQIQLSEYDIAIKNLKIGEQVAKGEIEPGVYRGKEAYAKYAPKSSQNIRTAKYTGSLGPVRAQQHIKTSCRFDYAYGLCKDWKVSGYCGYGDSCIFVHDRSEFKTGWELEKEWEEEQKRKKERKKSECSEEKQREEVCGACQRAPKDPVKTICGHLFCYRCALLEFAVSTKCGVCKKETNGIFNNVRWHCKY